MFQHKNNINNKTLTSHILHFQVFYALTIISWPDSRKTNVISPTLGFPGTMLNFQCPNSGIYPILYFIVFFSEFLLGSSKALEWHLCWNLPQLNAEVVKTSLVYIAVEPMGIDMKCKFRSCSRYQEVPLCIFSHKLCISV